MNRGVNRYCSLLLHQSPSFGQSKVANCSNHVQITQMSRCNQSGCFCTSLPFSLHLFPFSVLNILPPGGCSGVSLSLFRLGRLPNLWIVHCSINSVKLNSAQLFLLTDAFVCNSHQGRVCPTLAGNEDPLSLACGWKQTAGLRCTTYLRPWVFRDDDTS